MQRIHDIYRLAEERTRDWREVERMLGDCASGASFVVRALASGKSLPLE